MSRRSPVVEITGKTHKYRGEKAVIQFTAAKTYHVRLLNKKRPDIERFIFGKDGKIVGMKSSQITFYISKANVKDAGKFAQSHTNTWQGETLKFWKAHEGMTRKQVEAKYGLKSK